MTFWSDDNANLRISDKTKSALLNNFEIININFNSNFKLQPGDVSLMKGHTALYAGEVNGKRMWYDGGRWSTYEVASGSQFKNFYRAAGNSLSNTRYVIRLKNK